MDSLVTKMSRWQQIARVQRRVAEGGVEKPGEGRVG